MYTENDILPVRDVESLDSLDLDGLPLFVPSHDEVITLDDLVAIEDWHDLDNLDLNSLPDMPASCRRENL